VEERRKAGKSERKRREEEKVGEEEGENKRHVLTFLDDRDHFYQIQELITETPSS
jgi:hypothetical protein